MYYKLNNLYKGLINVQVSANFSLSFALVQRVNFALSVKYLMNVTSPTLITLFMATMKHAAISLTTVLGSYSKHVQVLNIEIIFYTHVVICL